jgi:hypothetical protein
MIAYREVVSVSLCLRFSCAAVGVLVDSTMHSGTYLVGASVRRDQSSPSAPTTKSNSAVSAG